MLKFPPVAILSVFCVNHAAGVDFEKEIWPFIEAKCVECHKAPFEEDGRTKKPKAGLRLDGAWAWTVGSENGKVLEPGDAEGSEMFYRVTLPEDDDDFMPPTGKADPLTPDEIALFKTWIEDGADFGGWQGNLDGKPLEVTKTGEEIPVSEIQETYKRLGAELPAIEEKQWAQITEQGGRVQKLAKDSPLVSVDFRLSGEDVTDEKIGPVSSIAPHVAHLDLSKTAVTDEAVAIVKELPNLVRLDLSQTGVGDAALANLGGLKELRYINLYGTQVTDKGLTHLEKLPNLEAIYLWQSKATPAGAKKLSKALPDATVNLK